MRRRSSQFTAPTKAGVTLVEVLMSLMIMSIGIAGVAAIFPVAALRSAQATKLTSAAMLKLSAESIVNTSPELIFDPDGDFSPSETVVNQRAALTEHFATLGNRNYIVDPNGYMSHAEAGLPSYDPAIKDNVANLLFCNWFGNNGMNAPYTGSATLRGLRRFDGGLQSRTVVLSSASSEQKRAMRLIAAKDTGLGDHWETVLDEEISSASLVTTGPGSTAEGITFDPDVDLSGVIASTNSTPRTAASALLIRDPELYRITLFSLTGRMSQVYPLTRIAGQTCYWTESGEDLNFDGRVNASRPLPSEFGGEISRALIQVKRTNDFNWFLTVRRGSNGAARGIDVCVTFSNGIEPDDEWVYPAITDADNNGTAEGGFVKGAFSAEITYSTSDPEPSVKRGGFVLDVHNARWYRVVDYRELSGVNTSNAASASLTTIQMDFETEIVDSSPTGSGVIFLPTLVDVYPLGGLSLPSVFEEASFK